MLTDYLTIVAMAALAVLFGVASLVVSRMFRPHRPNPVKLSAYESGNDPVRLPKGEKFSVKFYVVAMLFIIFDIEAIFLIPWAVAFGNVLNGTNTTLKLLFYGEMMSFIAILFAGLIYIWKKGVLQWNQ